MRSDMSAQRSESPGLPEKESGAQIPNPDLNPMVNATLSRNLGKWAEVYYTSPPEKREQAVVDLLRELQGAGDGNGKSAKLPVETKPDSVGIPEPVADVPSFRSPSVCSSCGHNNTLDQVFCGYCGAALKGSAPRREASVPQELPLNNHGVLLPPQSPTSRMTETEESDLEWLREKTLTSFGSYEEKQHPLRTLVAVVLVIALVGFFYYEWQSRASAPSYQGPAVRVSSTAARHAPEPEGKSNETNQASVPSIGSPSESELAKPPCAEKTPASDARSELINDSRRTPEPITRTSPRRGELVQPISSDTGTRELAIATTFLQGGARARDTSEAAKWLWKSVSKHNSAALVVLADLYTRGDGVAKSCDQAQVLLVAAAKKGSAEAGQRLRNLQSSGCK